jgi:endonuclease/exonuclease/phosphatase family metal-dependent hydrolase
MSSEPGEHMKTVRIMTINIRHNKDFADERIPLIADEIVRLRPDIIGIQEMFIGGKQSKALLAEIAKKSQNDPLAYNVFEHLKSWPEAYTGEGVTIFSRFPIIAKNWVKLGNSRIVLFARVDAGNGLKLDVYNTHLHNQGADAVRLDEAKIITDTMTRNDAGNVSFLTGDMNSVETDGTIRHYITYGLEDTYRSVHTDRTPIDGNTNPVIMSKDNARQNFNSRIDFIFMKTPFNGTYTTKLRDSVVCFKNAREDGLYPTDHLGVMTTVEITY